MEKNMLLVLLAIKSVGVLETSFFFSPWIFAEVELLKETSERKRVEKSLCEAFLPKGIGFLQTKKSG